MTEAYQKGYRAFETYWAWSKIHPSLTGDYSSEAYDEHYRQYEEARKQWDNPYPEVELMGLRDDWLKSEYGQFQTGWSDAARDSQDRENERVKALRDEHKQEKIVVETGGIDEENDWALIKNYILSDASGYTPCCHAKHLGDKTFLIPFAVRACNEGGYGSTLVCGECVEEAMAKARNP